MNYLVTVISHNEVHYNRLFTSKRVAEEQCIELANEWYNKDGVNEYLPHQIETINDMNSYYKSESYFNSDDYVHVIFEEVTI